MTRFRLVTYNFLLQIWILRPKNELNYIRTIWRFLRFHVPTWWTRWKIYLSQQNDPSHDPSLKSQNFVFGCWLLLGPFSSSSLVLFITHQDSKKGDQSFNVSRWPNPCFHKRVASPPMVAHHRIWTHCYKLRVHHTRRCDMMTWDFNLVVYVFISQVEDRWQAMRMHGGWMEQQILIWKKKFNSIWKCTRNNDAAASFWFIEFEFNLFYCLVQLMEGRNKFF